MQGLAESDARLQEDPRAEELYRAAEQGDLERVRGLLESGAPVNGVASFGGLYPLAGAVKHPEIARLMLEAGADVTASHVNGDTALHFAVGEGVVDVVSMLLEAGALVNQANGAGDTALHWAASASRERDLAPVVTMLLEAGASVNQRNGSGDTPLHVAASSVRDRSDLIAVLLGAGADVAARDHKELTPLHCAATSGNPRHVKLLLDARADVNAPTDLGALPIHAAATSDIAWAGLPEVVRLLLGSGSKLNAADIQLGGTPLHWAARGGLDDVVAVLLEAGADPNKHDKEGKTPAHWAEHGWPGGHPELAASIRAREKHGLFGFGHR